MSDFVVTPLATASEIKKTWSTFGSSQKPFVVGVKAKCIGLMPTQYPEWIWYEDGVPL